MKTKAISNKKKPNILLLKLSGFFGSILFGVILIMSRVYFKQDEIHRGERIVEQLTNNKYLK